MTTAKDIKLYLYKALAMVMDEPLKNVGFMRSPKSHIYKRSISESTHEICIVMDCHPTFRPDADAFIHPHILWYMRKVAKEALKMVEGNSFLLAKTSADSDLILNQPISFLTPNVKFEYWLPTGPEQFIEVCEKVKSFVSEWVLPFLAEATSPRDLVTLYERNDNRVSNQRHWHIYIAAAYQLLGEEEKARDVIRRHFSKPGIKPRYEVLFKSMDIE